MKAPFPWFGGKSRVADIVWQRFGDVPNFVEPFFGSGAVLLKRPEYHTGRTETANDFDGYVANFWRALQHEPEAVATYADTQVNENDLHARHSWLLQHRDELRPRLEGDPDYYDAKVAGWWVWGICAWIGQGWCSGNGPWQVVNRQLVHLGNKGRGVNRQRMALNRPGHGINQASVTRQVPNLRGDSGAAGQGVHAAGTHRKIPRIGPLAPVGAHGQTAESGGIYDWFDELSARLRYVRITCGDWKRVLGPSPTYKHGLTGVFLDPPYGAEADRENDLYRVDSLTIADDVRRYCLESGDNPKLRIALCGYAGEGHEELEAAGWSVHAWKAQGGYGGQNSNGNENPHKERIWFSPHCLGTREALLERFENGIKDEQVYDNLPLFARE